MKETASNEPLFLDDDNMSTSAYSKSSEESGDALEPLAHKESIAVKRSKILVFVALMLAAVAVAVPTYMLSAKGEKDDFEEDVSGRKNCVLCLLLLVVIDASDDTADTQDDRSAE